MLFVAEIGSNWRVSPDLNECFKVVERGILDLIELGADVIKFQYFKVDKMYSKEALKRKDIQALKYYELPLDLLLAFKRVLRNHNMPLMVSFFDQESLQELNGIADIYKIASAEALDVELFKSLRSEVNIVISLGGITFRTIEKMYNEVWQYNAHNLTLQYCMSQYPASFRHLNLLLAMSIDNLCRHRNLGFGFSDHTLDNYSALILSNLTKLKYIEKHVKFDNGVVKTPDSAHSLTLLDFAKFVRVINSRVCVIKYKDIETDIDVKLNEAFAEHTRFLYYKKIIKQGSYLRAEDLVSLRAGAVINKHLRYIDLKELEGCILRKDRRPGDPVLLSDVIDTK